MYYKWSKDFLPRGGRWRKEREKKVKISQRLHDERSLKLENPLIEVVCSAREAAAASILPEIIAALFIGALNFKRSRPRTCQRFIRTCIYIYNRLLHVCVCVYTILKVRERVYPLSRVFYQRAKLGNLLF